MTNFKGFTFDFDQTIVDIYDTQVRGIADDAATTLDRYLTMGNASVGLSVNHRGQYVSHVHSQGFATMDRSKLAEYVKYACNLIGHCGSWSETIDVIMIYNDFRLANNGKYTFSLQHLHSWIVNGKVHGTDTVGKRVHGVKTIDEADEALGSDSDAEESFEQFVSERKGSVLQSILALLQSPELDLDDRTVIDMCNAHQKDKMINTRVEVKVTK